MIGNVRKKHCSKECAYNGRRYKEFFMIDIEKDVIENYSKLGPKPFVEKYDLPITRVYDIANRNGIKAPNLRGNAVNSNPPKTFVCLGCGDEFKQVHYPSRKEPKFCSKECRRIRIKKICPICNKEFEIRPCREKSENYCSKNCSNQGMKRDEIKCIWCGKNYSPIHKDRKYCSITCHAEHRKSTRLDKVCETCYKKYKVRKGYPESRFCCKKCQVIGTAKRGPDSPHWRGGPINGRGENWNKQAEKARKRDNYTCQMCGLEQRKPKLHVHHIKPFRDFDGDYISANKLSNLITYCHSCHMIIEQSLKPRNDTGQYIPPN